MGIEGEELSKTGKINKSSFTTIVFNRINSSQTILVPGWLNELGSWITYQQYGVGSRPAL